MIPRPIIIIDGGVCRDIKEIDIEGGYGRDGSLAMCVIERKDGTQKETLFRCTVSMRPSGRAVFNLETLR